jgi:hypothetical protein
MMTGWELENNTKAVYRYFKEKLGLVHINYARKVLGVSEAKFRKIAAHYNLEVVEYPAPVWFKSKFYDLKKVYEIKEKIQNANEY